VHRDADLADFDTLTHTHAVDAADILSEPLAHEHTASLADVDASIAFRDGDADTHFRTHHDADAHTDRDSDAYGSVTLSDEDDVRDNDSDTFRHSLLHAVADSIAVTYLHADLHLHLDVHLHADSHLHAELHADLLRRELLHTHGHADLHADAHTDDHTDADASVQDRSLERRGIPGTARQSRGKRRRNR
jgi:hypothetical protein